MWPLYSVDLCLSPFLYTFIQKDRNQGAVVYGWGISLMDAYRLDREHWGSNADPFSWRLSTVLSGWLCELTQCSLHPYKARILSPTRKTLDRIPTTVGSPNAACCSNLFLF